MKMTHGLTLTGSHSKFAWILKILITRIGGIGLYRQLAPGFLGVALGHFFTAGILWGTLAAIGDDIFRGYGVWFG